MRKYQQLALMLICCASICVLLLYKNENMRLKSVLHVVNFFGRSDVQFIENATKHEDEHHFAWPLPLWQALGNSGFYTYSAYWSRNELVQSGQAVALAVAKQQAVVNFRCSLHFESSNGELRSLPGKFGFQRLNEHNENREDTVSFDSYLFYCKSIREPGSSVPPIGVTFSEDKSAGNANMLKLRSTMPIQTAQVPLSVCLDLSVSPADVFSANSSTLLQFVLLHQAEGMHHFIIYNGFEIPPHLQFKLQRMNAHIYLLPFNFPFETAAPTEAYQTSMRQLIQTDCLMRNLHRARYTIQLNPYEFMLTSLPLSQPQSLITTLQHYASKISNFQLPVFAVCLNPSNKLLLDNTKYNPEAQAPYASYIFRPASILTALSHSDESAIALTITNVLLHRYVECNHIGADGLHNWSQSLREDFSLHLKTVREKIANGLLLP